MEPGALPCPLGTPQELPLYSHPALHRAVLELLLRLMVTPEGRLEEALLPRCGGLNAQWGACSASMTCVGDASQTAVS